MNCKTITLPKHACKWNKAMFDHVLKSFLQKVTLVICGIKMRMNCNDCLPCTHDSDSIGFNLSDLENSSGSKI